MGMPPRKRVGDSLERSNENKKKQKENISKKTLKWNENEMDPSVKSLPKECHDCKSRNHKFWMFANQNLKQPH